MDQRFPKGGDPIARLVTMDGNAQSWFDGLDHWPAELDTLRNIVRRHPLDETLKWGRPCYVRAGRDVLALGAFKHHFGIWFFDGCDMADPNRRLVNAQPGKTQRMRHWRMHSVDDIVADEVDAYVVEAIRVAESSAGGGGSPARANTPVPPSELARALEADRALRSAFDGLTPGRQREYAAHIAEAKRAETRIKRLETIKPMILAGVGLNDRYR